jgi:hypothetical protein
MSLTASLTITCVLPSLCVRVGDVLICRRRGDESFEAALLASCPTTKSGHYLFGVVW